MYWPGRGKDGRGETENKEETLKIKIELMGNRRLLIFYADAKNATSIMEENNISKWRIYYV